MPKIARTAQISTPVRRIMYMIEWRIAYNLNRTANGNSGIHQHVNYKRLSNTQT